MVEAFKLQIGTDQVFKILVMNRW